MEKNAKQNNFFSGIIPKVSNDDMTFVYLICLYLSI